MSSDKKFYVLTEEELEVLLEMHDCYRETGLEYDKPPLLNEFQAVAKITGNK